MYSIFYGAQSKNNNTINNGTTEERQINGTYAISQHCLASSLIQIYFLSLTY